MSRKFKTRLGSLIIISALSGLVYPVQAEQWLTWEQCVQEAKRQQQSLKIAKAKLEEAYANETQAQSQLYPQISGRLSYQKSHTQGYPDAQDSYLAQLTAQQLIFDGFKVFKQISQASSQARAAELDYQDQSSQVRQQLREAFIEVLRVQMQKELTRTIADRRKQNLGLVQLRYNAGREHRGSLRLAEAQSAQAEADVSQAERGSLLAQYQMSQALGRVAFTPVVVQGDLALTATAMPAAPDFSLLANQHPSIRRWQAEADAAQAGVDIATSAFYPSLTANGSLGRSDEVFPPAQASWSVGLALTWPLFTGGSRLAQISQAREQLYSIQAQVESNLQNVQLRLLQTWINYQNALTQGEVQKNFLDAEQERAKIADAQYSAGLIDFNNWTIIEDATINAQKNYLDSHANTLKMEAEWIQAQGGTLEDEK